MRPNQFAVNEKNAFSLRFPPLFAVFVVNGLRVELEGILVNKTAAPKDVLPGSTAGRVEFSFSTAMPKALVTPERRHWVQAGGTARWKIRCR